MPKTSDYIEEHVEKIPGSGCWIWMGCVNEFGYGRVRYEGRNLKAHRLSYALHIGEIPDGKVLMHSCDVRCCVNPAHLRPATQGENLRDMVRKGRQNPVSLLNLKNPTRARGLVCDDGIRKQA